MSIASAVPRAAVWAAAAALCASSAHAGFYNDRVKPILSQHCFACHGPDAAARKAGLRLDVPQAESGLSAGRLAELFSEGRDGSLIYERITAPDPADRMPPVKKSTLTPEEIEVIGAWLDSGAEYEKHWAFSPPEWPEIPAVQDSGWERGSIDRFVLARLERDGIAPSPLADPVTQIRRLHLDLTGLPPSIEEVDAFVENPSDAAYEAAADRLLASPHFGERWGRRWLDRARYADSHGYSIDGPRSIWPYRDWVINAINADKPYDAFVVEQLAGDLLPDATRDQRVATGFNRNTMINQEGGIDKEEFRIEAVTDRVNTAGAVFLGLTLSCAKCHDHKYDPIYQDEYFQLFAFFNDDDEIDLELPTPGEEATLREARAKISEITPERDAYREHAIAEKLPQWIAGLDPEDVKTWHLKEQEAVARPIAEWTDEHRAMMEKRFLGMDAEYQAFEKRIREIESTMPGVARTMVLRRRAEPRKSHVFVQGDFTRLGEQVQPGVPGVLHDADLPENPTRLDLARWIVGRGNPLTARVTVNRYWQELFGRGLVETENDFGYQGALPTHPALLDYLANRFIARGWSMKAIIREIVLSSAYRQASHARLDLETIDPKNYLLARQNRIRLDAEIIRDATLAASGMLNPAIGGPGVYPPLPDGVMKLGQVSREWATSIGPDRFRRGMYTYFWRATPHPSLVVFDAPDATVSCTRRSRSNTPLQALTLLNDQAFYEQAEALAARIVSARAASDSERLEHAFRVCLGRWPEPREKAVLQDLLAAARQQSPRAPDRDWLLVARALLNLDEFITRE
ncbi:MAG: PSD1 domain-containing protein [Candidatus Hydrogenedentes bacterium]|nr:PSD1 domain-containing protein [Candidatus Hydrogenedentota bacterium]